MELRIDTDAAEVFVANMQRYFDLDASVEEEFAEGLRRLAAVQYMMEDLLRDAGITTEPLTQRAQKARTNNPFYAPTRANAGRKP